jgi:tRNA(Arg) A34 adenosine deaminase TadA
MFTDADKHFLERAIKLSKQGMEEGHGGPFGCVIVRENVIIGEGYNSVITNNDPTAHAEIVAIRAACTNTGNYQLTGCDVYSSCEPCPMCLGAIYWSRPERVIYANTREQAAAIAFDDAFIYQEINKTMTDRKIPFLHLPHAEALKIFTYWKNWEGKKVY